ncbi:hypothetical protein [Clostridium ihumii]|nr:hypothetical protein [Clostridium ihumii]
MGKTKNKRQGNQFSSENKYNELNSEVQCEQKQNRKQNKTQMNSME